MKKKILIELLSIISIFACAFAISACGEKEHTHNYGEVIAEQPATCTATGMKAHYHCADCGKYFDEDKVEKTVEELTIAIDSTAHTYGALIPEQPATCAAPGMKAYYHCADCGKYFDEDKTEVSQQQLVIPVNRGLHELNINSDVCSVCGDPLTAGLEYTLMDNDAYSVKKGSATDIDIIIPAKYNGKPVTAIGYTAFYNCTSLESVIIPDSVIAIGGGAFRNCKSLKRITIPDNVTEIGMYAFSDCTSLVNVAFANTTGWQISFSSSMSNAKPAPDLSSPTQNAQHLTGTYKNYIWKRG